ncbi:MAG: STAS domain-containing protein [Chlorobiaceae bacterium]|nr:STAS domain-containing protein [Chlorobiaceae bacterium]
MCRGLLFVYKVSLYILPSCLYIHFDTAIFMKSSVTVRRELTVLKIEEGTFDLRHGEACNSAVADLLAREESKNLIIDFSDVKAIDPTVIASIRFAQECANKCGGVVIFVALCKAIKELLKLQELDKQLYLYSSVYEILTLIAPDVKGKRAARVKKTVHPDEIIDELLKHEVIAIPDISVNLHEELDVELDVGLDVELDVELDEELDEDSDAPMLESDEPAPSVTSAAKESGIKKRGRAKSAVNEGGPVN